MGDSVLELGAVRCRNTRSLTSTYNVVIFRCDPLAQRAVFNVVRSLRERELARGSASPSFVLHHHT
jgi:hypothetical protein